MNGTRFGILAVGSCARSSNFGRVDDKVKAAGSLDVEANAVGRKAPGVQTIESLDTVPKSALQYRTKGVEVTSAPLLGSTSRVCWVTAWPA